jgi:hypothetical protein
LLALDVRREYGILRHLRLTVGGFLVDRAHDGFEPPFSATPGAVAAALHERHIREIDRLVETKLMEHAASRLDTLMRAMVEAMIDAHTPDPKLYELLSTEVPHRAEGTRDFAVRLHGAFRLAIASRAEELKSRRDLDTVVFVVTHMVEALSHAAVLRRPPHLSLADAKEEVVRAVLAYLHAERD